MTDKTKAPRKAPATLSRIIYQGPSLIDGNPIVVIATIKTKNAKTGDMVQTWILRADIDPVSANRIGADFSICGQCPFRGIANLSKKSGVADFRECYVNLMGPNSIFKTYKAGKYPVAIGHDNIAQIGAGRMVRLGSYGDGAAVPAYIWDSLLSRSAGHTGYTHQMGQAGACADPARYMVSADSLEFAREQWDQGNRTFRVINSVSDIEPGKEILCPASEEAGYRTTCDKCKLCSGNGIAAKSIAIVNHSAARSAIKNGAKRKARNAEARAAAPVLN